MNSKLYKLRVFDSHCHLQFTQYDKDRDEIIRRALDAGVSMICVGTDLEMSKKGIELAEKHEGIWATVGLHPNDIEKATSDQWLVISDLLSESKVVAVGEVGLDYYRTTEPEKQKKQKEIFEQFLDLSAKCDKPVILHSRDAGKGSIGKVHGDMVEILLKKSDLFHDRSINQIGVMHSFTGTEEDAKKYLEMGFYLGFNGILTFTSQYDEVVKYVPLDRILLETDAPFLAPEPYRGTRNEPIYVIEVAKKVAELKNEKLEKVIEQTTENCKNLFKLI